MRILALLALLVPTAVLAQPPPPPPPPPGYAPAPVYAPQQTIDNRNGMTLELNLGVGFMWATSEGEESDKKVALGGLDLGVGGWLSNRLALTIRIAGVTYTETEGDTDLRWTTGFLGPSAQYWLDNNFWIGGGVGAGVVAVSVNDGEDSDSEVGLGLDLRAGYTFGIGSEHSWNLSVELNPSFVEILGQEITFYGGAVLIGYQHL
jgi:hypothetical protein